MPLSERSWRRGACLLNATLSRGKKTVEAGHVVEFTVSEVKVLACFEKCVPPR